MGKMLSRLHLPANFCRWGKCCERYIIHPSFTSRFVPPHWCTEQFYFYRFYPYTLKAASIARRSTVRIPAKGVKDAWRMHLSP